MWRHQRGEQFRSGATMAHTGDHRSWRSAEQSLTRLLDLGIASLIFMAPLFLGGRHPLGRLVYVTLICLTAIVWAARQAVRPRATWRLSGAEWLILAGVGLLLLQLAHLPQRWLTTISPNLTEFLPLWFTADSPANLGQWSQLSVYPEATRGALVMFVSYAVFFLLLVQRIETLEDIERLFRWIALAAVGMAVIAILQMVAGNGKLLWIYRHPAKDAHGVAQGPFSCENHLAHLLAISVVPLLWWAQHLLNSNKDDSHSADHRVGRSAFGNGKSSKDLRLSLSLVGIGIVTLACLLTFSRGGVLVILLAVGTCVLSYFMASLLGRKSLFAVVGIALLLVVALLSFGFEKLTAEMGSVATGTADDLDVGGLRRELWAADLKTFQKFSVVGTGVGSHPDVYPIHFERNLHVELRYAESGYVQLLMEAGIAGATLFAAAMALIVYWCGKIFRGTTDPRVRSLLFAIIAVLLASLAQSIWDFVWYIPACLVVTLIFVACLCRLSQIVGDASPTNAPRHDAPLPARRYGPTRLLWAAGMVVAIVTSYQMVSFQIPAARGSSSWDAYQIAVYAAQRQPDPIKVQETVLSTLPALKSAASRDKNNARVHLKLAAVAIYQFNAVQQTAINPMTLDEIRDAALGAGFASLNEQNQWLEKAVGENIKILHLAYHHAWRAAKLSPFQGEAYIHLNRLKFLYEPPQDASDHLMQQALLVRPHQGSVLITAGGEAARSGDLPRAMKYLRRAFHKGREHRRRVIAMVAPHVSATLFLDEFQPDQQGLGELIDFYRGLDKPDDLRAMLPRYVAFLEEEGTGQFGVRPAANWLRAYSTCKLLAENEQALRCAKMAVHASPDNTRANVAYANELIEARQFEQALQHLRSCLYRRPDVAELKRLFVLARRKQGKDGLANPQDATAGRNNSRR